MNVLSIAAAAITLILIVLTLVPSAGDFRGGFSIGAVVCSAVTLLAIVTGRRRRAPHVQAAAPAPAATPVAQTRPVTAPPAAAPSGDAQVVGFLATLQEKGRLVDFLQDDIAGYSDAQVGAAARVVHQGCRLVLDEYVQIVPVRPEAEGANVTVPAGYAADEYRLVGKISGQAPFTGTLMHRGWKAESVTLPRIMRAEDGRLPIVAPAEVELR